MNKFISYFETTNFFMISKREASNHACHHNYQVFNKNLKGLCLLGLTGINSDGDQPLETLPEDNLLYFNYLYLDFFQNL